MYSAWLEVEDGWRRTEDYSEVLDHVGDFIVCDTGDDESSISEQIAAATGKHTIHQFYDFVELFDVPVFVRLTEEAVDLLKNGEKCKILRMYSSGGSFKDVIFYNNPVCPEGIVEVYGADGNRVVAYDLDLWQKTKRGFEDLQKKQRENPKITSWAFECVADKLAANMQMGCIKQFRVEQFLAWVLAHDQMFGKRATNKVIKNLARSWSKNPEGYKRFYKRWVTEEVLEKLEERFKKVVKFPKSE